ncbi:putative dienelactone hydrolase [Paucibacter oligotrophus]|uniref:Putative dienelactone hydrolase n=1 Tax=Roseateles oligotrophus TaxID=1769250 RepID=A0A840LGG6_9BURK|nr:acetylhydrolase [Roseateles oligotrophus]MBB4845713.1 putative dienelactone hydrolase [Roseateles oligotrophus]
MQAIKFTPLTTGRWLLALGLAGLLGLSACKSTPVDSRRVPTQAQSQPEVAADSVWAKEALAAGVQVFDLDWQDESRDRAVPVRLYWPQPAQQGQAVPLVLFSHGIGSSRRGYSYLGAYLAAQGYASLHVQHVGSDRQLWLGNPLQLVERLQTAAREQEVLARVADVKFALDRLLRSERAGLIDAERIAVAGHSYGANTSLLLAGARVQRAGHALELREPRIKAAILISAPPFYGEADTAAIAGAIPIPSLHITATEDVIRIPGYYSEAKDRVALFEAIGGPSKMLAVFEGGSHSMFTDRGLTGGASLNPRAKQATKELAVAFLDDVLLGRPQALQRWGGPYRDILARWQTPYSSGVQGSLAGASPALRPALAGPGS